MYRPSRSIWVNRGRGTGESPHPQYLLDFNELAVEEIDEDIALAWMKGVLPELNNRLPAILLARAGLRTTGCGHLRGRSAPTREVSDPVSLPSLLIVDRERLLPPSRGRGDVRPSVAHSNLLPVIGVITKEVADAVDGPTNLG